LLQGSGGITPPSAIKDNTQNHSSYAGAGKRSQQRGSLKDDDNTQNHSSCAGAANEASKEAA
jgi:hypothetical protein